MANYGPVTRPAPVKSDGLLRADSLRAQMITRVRVDGYKTLSGVDVQMSPLAARHIGLHGLLFLKSVGTMMYTGAKTKCSTIAWLALGALIASCGSERQDPPPTPLTKSSTPSVKTRLTCEYLNTLPVGVRIRNGPPPNSYQPPLMDIAAHPFTWSNLSTTTNGEAKTENTGKAGGTGVEIAVNNLVLSISRGFGQVLHQLSFAFGEYGGNINLSVNNTVANVANFAALNSTVLGGVNITVLSGGLGNDKGVIKFEGSMTDQGNRLGQLAVGGQELWIDNICFKH